MDHPNEVAEPPDVVRLWCTMMLVNGGGVEEGCAVTTKNCYAYMYARATHDVIQPCVKRLRLQKGKW